MYVDEIATLFRAYTDEGDQTYLTDANVTTYLAQAYKQFRARICEIDYTSYATTVDIVPAGTSYNLATGTVKILGSGTLTHARLFKLIHVLRVPDGSATGLPTYPLRAARSDIELLSETMVYLLSGVELRFGSSLTGTLRLVYIPYDQIDWTKIVPGNNTFVDDFQAYHDIVALLAYQIYAVRDRSMNALARELLKERLDALDAYVTNGRNPEAGSSVMRSDGFAWWGSTRW